MFIVICFVSLTGVQNGPEIGPGFDITDYYCQAEGPKQTKQ
jgi:hypothetical protein